MADPVIDDIKARIDIADLVGQRVQLKRAGRYLKGLCPFHQEKSPSFVVYPDQGNYHCFGCGKSGDHFTWLQETEHLDFGEALRRLADQAGVQLPERGRHQPDPDRQASADALTEAATWYHEQLLRAPEAAEARAYLVRRGLKAETVQRFGIGWAPDRRELLVRHLRGKGITDQQLTDSGVVRETERGLIDYMGGRVVFPIRDGEGKVRGFGGRTLGDNQPKYLNSPQTAFFDKSATLFGLDLARSTIRKDGIAVIVEGYMDVVVPHQEGFTNVVASLGTALTEPQIELVKRYATTIILALDSDAAGQAATLRGLELARVALSESRRPVPGRATRSGFLQTQNTQLKVAVVSGGKDPDEIVREDPEAWRRIVNGAVPMVDHKIAVTLRDVTLSDAAGKTAAVQELSRFLTQVADPIEFDHYVDVVAQRLRLDIRAVRAEVAIAKEAQRVEERRRAAQERERRRAAEQNGDASPATSPGSKPPPQAKGLEAPHEDTTEEQLVSLLLLEPHLARRLPSKLAPEEFRRPECRELYRAVLDAGVEVVGVRNGPEWPGSIPTEPDLAADNSLRDSLAGTLRDHYDDLTRKARAEPPKTDAQVQSALTDMMRRIRERNLHQRVLEAHYLLSEAQGPDEMDELKRRVGTLTSQLLRVQLERSRASLYTSPPAS